MFVKACDQDELQEGHFKPVGIGRTLVLLVWPEGGRLRAVQGICPHAEQLLIDARFDGRTLTCRYHDWAFDAETGICVRGRPCGLAEYPLRIVDGTIEVDVEGISPNRLLP